MLKIRYWNHFEHAPARRNRKALETLSVIRSHNKRGIAATIRSGISFSMIIDESTDRGHVKCLAIIVRVFQVNVVRDRFLGLIEIDDHTALGIFRAITAKLEAHDIPLKNLIGFAADNASVMMGKTNGVQALLKKYMPHIFVLGCVCHSFVFCAEGACRRCRMTLNNSHGIFLDFPENCLPACKILLSNSCFSIQLRTDY